MTSLWNLYLSVKDPAREALELCRDALGGDLETHTFGQYGDQNAPEGDPVMHARPGTAGGNA